MEILQNLQTEDFTQLIIIVAVLLVVLFLARLAFKLTASLMRIGCLAIFLIVAAVAMLRVFSG
ncbi:MAG: hypothetical protein KC445_01945 [Anaerolineales bacterium]|nr:hypothetical protein [Anaerolineales bacterium]